MSLKMERDVFSSELPDATNQPSLSGTDPLVAYDNYSSKLLEEAMIYPETQIQNVLVLSLVLLLALLSNFLALPVILFRRTKFGNGLFAVLILCLTISDMAVILFSVLGSLIVEASHLLWGGAPGSCKVKWCNL